MWSLAWEPHLWKRKYMYTNSESIPYYFEYFEYSYLNVTFWPIVRENKFLIKPKSHCAEWARIDDLSLFGWSFLVILAMTMTINSNSVFLMRVASAGRKENFAHVHVPSLNNFHSCLCALKTCSYRLCRTAYVLYSSHFHWVLVDLTVY